MRPPSKLLKAFEQTKAVMMVEILALTSWMTSGLELRFNQAEVISGLRATMGS